MLKYIHNDNAFFLLLQISVVKTVFLMLVILWFYGMLPIAIAIPLNHFIDRRSLEGLESSKEKTCKVIVNFYDVSVVAV